VFRANVCESNCAVRRTMTTTGRPVVNATAHIVNQQGQRVPIRISTALLQTDNMAKCNDAAWAGFRIQPSTAILKTNGGST